MPLMPKSVSYTFAPFEIAGAGEEAIASGAPAPSPSVIRPAATAQSFTPRPNDEVSPPAASKAGEGAPLGSALETQVPPPASKEALSGKEEPSRFKPGPVIQAPKALRGIATNTVETSSVTGRSDPARKDPAPPGSFGVSAPQPRPAREPQNIAGSPALPEDRSYAASAPAPSFESGRQSPASPASTHAPARTRAVPQATSANQPSQIQAESRATMRLPSGGESSRSTPEQGTVSAITRQPDARPIPARPAAPATAPPASAKRQGRITIGQIDVQVNNHPPAPTTNPPPPARSLTSDILEKRYLDRFPLRP